MTDPTYLDHLRQGGWSGEQERPWASHAVVVLAVAMVASTLLAAANVAVDPFGEFRTGHPTVVPRPVREKLAGYADLPAAPERLVLGSSRLASLPPEGHDLPAFNLALPDGRFHDTLAVYEAVRAHGGAPTEAIVGLDSFLLTEHARSGGALDKDSPAAVLAGGGPRSATDFAAVAGTLRPGYVLATMKALAYDHVTGYPEPAMRVDARGVLHFDGLERRLAAGEYDRAAALEAHWSTYLRPAYEKEPDATAIAEARALLAALAADGVEVHAVFMPFHPEAAERLAGVEGFLRLEQEVRTLALSFCGPGFHVHDLTTAASAGVEEKAFVDGVHLTGEGSAAVAEAILAGKRDLCAPGSGLGLPGDVAADPGDGAAGTPAA